MYHFQPKDRVNFQIESILETGIDEMSWDDNVGFNLYLLGKMYEIMRYLINISTGYVTHYKPGFSYTNV